MADATSDELIAGMTGESTQRLAAFGGLLRGVGAEVLAEYNDFVKTLHALPGVGQATASRVAALRADDSLPLDHRRRLEHETRDAAEIVLRKTPAAAHQAIPRLRSMLEDGLLPKPAKDPTSRLLVRQELQSALGAQQGTSLEKVRKVIGQNASWDGELLSDFGGAMLGEDLKTVRAVAVGKWMSRTDGSEKQVSARRVLAAWDQANLPGAVAAYSAAARAHLTRDEPLPARQQP